MKRRKILAFLFATMVAVILVGGWGASSGGDISTIAPKADERIVMWADLPATGTPEDYDLLSNLRFAAQKLYTSDFFKGESQGDVNAKVGPIPYTQHLNNMRMVKGNTVFAQTISTSSLVDSLEQQYSENDAIFMRKHESISKDGTVKWKNTASQMSMETYNSKYGTIPRELSKYIIGYTTNEDPTRGELGKEILTIEGCRDENATAAPALLSDGDGSESDEPAADGFDINGSGNLEIGFDVPQTLVAGSDGLYRFTLFLDPINSTKYYRNEVQTRADANDKPSFTKAQVTVVIDRYWTPISVTTTEVYSLYMMGFNATCSSTITEKFKSVGDAQADIPEDVRKFYKPYIDGASSGGTTEPTNPEPDKKPTTPIDYLSAAFADYFDGSKNLDIAADVSIDGLNIDDLRLSVNVKTLDIKAKLGKLGLQYSGDKVYITLNDTKGYVHKDKFLALMNDERISSLTGGLNLPDFGAILGDESIISTIFADCEMTTANGITRIRLPFTLEGIKVDASLYIKDDGMVLQSIEGEIDAFGKHITAVIKPKTTAFAKPDDTYVDLSPAIDFIPDAVATAMSPRYGIKGTVTTFDNTFGIDAYIDRANGLKVDATITALGQNITIKYVDGTVYINVGNIGISGTAEELPALLDAVSDITGIELGSLDEMLATVKKLLPRNVDEWLDMVKTISADARTLHIGAEFLASPIDVTLTRGNGKLDGLKLNVDVDVLNIEFAASANLALSTPQQKTVAPVGEYVPVSELTYALEAVKPYVDAESYALDIERLTVTSGDSTYDVTGKAYIDRIKTESGETVSAKATLSALGQTAELTFANDTVYAQVGNIKAKLALSDVDRLMPTVNELLGKLGIAIPDIGGMLPDASQIPALVSTALDSIKSFDVKNGKIYIELELDGNTVTASIDAVSGNVALDARLGEVTLALKCNAAITDSNGITSPDGEFMDIAELEPTLEALMPVIDSKSLTANASINVGDTAYSLELALSYNGALKAEIAERTLGLNVAVIDKTAYVSLADIKVAAGLDELPAVLDALGDIVPAEVKTAVLEILSGDISVDAESTVGAALAAVKSLTLKDGTLGATVEVSGVIATAEISTALDRITLRANVDGTEIAADVYGVKAGCKDISVNAEEYIPANKLAAVVSPIIPLVTRGGSYNFTLGFNAFGVDGKGSITINPARENADGTADGLEACADIVFGDLPMTVAYKNGNVYVNVADSIKLSCGTSKAELVELLDELDEAVPGIKQKVIDMYKMFADISLEKILGMVSAKNTADGFVLSFDTTDIGASVLCDIGFIVTDGDFQAITLDCEFADTHIEATAKVNTANGVISGIAVERAEIYTVSDGGRKDITSLTMSLDVADNAHKEVNVPADCAKLSTLTQYVAPIMGLIEKAQNVKSITLDLDAFMQNADGAQAKIGGDVTVSLSPALAVDAKIVLFDGALDENGGDASETVYITFAGNILYIKTGTVKLSFDVTSGTQKLYDILSAYLPEYLNKELAMLLGLDSGASMFSDISLLVERFKAVAQADGIEETVKLLFAELGGTNRNSAIKSVMAMIGLGETPRADGRTDLTLMLNALGLSANITPSLDWHNGKAELGNVSISTSIQGMFLKFDLVGLDMRSEVATVAVPDDAAEYVDIIEFVQVINNAISTFTATDSDGNITFEIGALDFDYDIFAKIPVLDELGNQLTDGDGNPVYKKDEAGRDEPARDEFGAKIVADKIRVRNIDGSPALVGKFVKTETTDENGDVKTSYKFNLEAHISLYVKSLANYCEEDKPIELSLYVINNDEYPNGLAVLDYYEGKSGYGERISIDYVSIMQLVAAVMDIVGADDETVDMLLGEYRLPIDTTVFDSMAIAGFDSVRDMLDGLVKAINEIKAGLGYIGDAWDLVYTAGDTETLRDRLDDTVKTEIIGGEEVQTVVSLGIKSYIAKALDCIKTAVAAFGIGGEEGTPEENTPPDPTERTEKQLIDGSLFKMIVNGIKFATGAVTDESGNTIDGKSFIKADIDNAVATQTEGVAHVTVTQSALSGKTVIDSISVGNLDVNTAKLGTVNVAFTAGKDVTVSVPDGVLSTQGNRTYSDLANVKHLLFDVMNTANMLEFEIGGRDTNDKIHINLTVGGVLANLDITVKYNAKVKIIKVGEDENGKPIYKTAAAVEIYNSKSQVKILGIGSTVVLPECTTNLFFYDDVLYIHGVKDWAYDVNIKHTKTNFLGIKSYDKGDYVSYTDVSYTVDELGFMMSNDMNRFLEEFVYLLIPITKDKIAGMIDVRGIIRDQLGGSSSGGDKDDSKNTIAQIFKGYTYTDGEHRLTIGLSELASSSSLQDVNVSLTGANDGDDNVLDNYVASLHVDTGIQNDLIKVDLDATLRNVSTPTKYYTDGEYSELSPGNAPTEYARNELESTGLSDIVYNKYYPLYTYKDVMYRFADGYTGTDVLIDNGHVVAINDEQQTYSLSLEKFIGSMLSDVVRDGNGKITDTVNRENGVQWQRVWKADYDAAQAA